MKEIFIRWVHFLRGQWLFHRGIWAMGKGQWQKGAEFLGAASRLLPENPFVHLHLAWAHWRLGHPVTARFHMGRATELQPQNPALWTMAGKLMALRGKWQEAERLLRQALVYTPNNPVALSWLALVLFQTSRDEEALEILREHPIADDPYLQARLVLHVERVALSREEHRDISPFSLPPWMRLWGLRHLFSWAFRWRGERLLEDGLWEAAAKWLGGAVQLCPEDPWARLLWAVALLESGDLTRAEEILFEIPEEIVERRLVQAALLVRRHAMKEASTLLQECDQQHPMTRYYLAVISGWYGEIDRACVIFLEPLYREDPASLRQRIRELLRRLGSKKNGAS